ncbi:MAG: hypothetical protein FJ308_14555 [Planctomycetes bacterium]|nr:hypothetical protein [Planctomycetota bacterium]
MWQRNDWAEEPTLRGKRRRRTQLMFATLLVSNVALGRVEAQSTLRLALPNPSSPSITGMQQLPTLGGGVPGKMPAGNPKTTGTAITGTAVFIPPLPAKRSASSAGTSSPTAALPQTQRFNLLPTQQISYEPKSFQSPNGNDENLLPPDRLLAQPLPAPSSGSEVIPQLTPQLELQYGSALHSNPPPYTNPLSVQHGADSTSPSMLPTSPAIDQLLLPPSAFDRLASQPSAIAPVDSGLGLPGSHHTRVGQNLSNWSGVGGEPLRDGCATTVPFQNSDFLPEPVTLKPLDPCNEIATYNGKASMPVQRPWVEWWRPFYTGGMYAPGIPVFSDVNLLQPSFLIYGDFRSAVGINRVGGQPARSWANRLNLDMDMRFTATERFHMFTGPLDNNGQFTRVDFSDGTARFEDEHDFQPDTAFFEGDLGAMTGGWIGDDAPFDLPFTCGLVPLLYQNGIWMEDAVAGFALGAPWRQQRALNWANYEATFFAGFNQVTSPAFLNDNNAAQVYGTAWFIEAYNGYIEADYAYLNDIDNSNFSYNNAAIAYTRRYFGRISNSVRLIGNSGQNVERSDRTADGALLLFENSWISSHPSTFVPYWNFFAGSGSPQSVARAAGAGGILRNTGINFETDGLTNYPTLNATGSNAYGGATGINMLSADFRKQLVLEFAALDPYGGNTFGRAAGPQYAIGARFQKALNNWTILRLDAMNGWLDGAPDIYGMRSELRWKF